MRRWIVGGLLAASISCGAPHWSDEAEVVNVPPGLQADYALFAQRCSKCHSLARPLTSGIDDDEYWKRYVERMRRQPGSGISPEDEPAILRFLHYYSDEQKKKKGARL
jgi:hypothetical protein